MTRPLSWTTVEYHSTPRGAEWFFAVGIIAAALIATGVLLRNFLFAGVIALAGIILLLYAARRPRRLAVEVGERGLRVGEAWYPPDELAGFWIDEENGAARLLVKRRAFFSLLIGLPIAGVHPNLVRAALKDFLPEIELHEPLAQKLMEYLGF